MRYMSHYEVIIEYLFLLDLQNSNIFNQNNFFDFAKNNSQFVSNG